jgi:hypothetical protein
VLQRDSSANAGYSDTATVVSCHSTASIYLPQGLFVAEQLADDTAKQSVDRYDLHKAVVALVSASLVLLAHCLEFAGPYLVPPLPVPLATQSYHCSPKQYASPFGINTTSSTAATPRSSSVTVRSIFFILALL